MDTGYVNLLTPEQKRQVLQFATKIVGGKRFVAGAFVEGYPGEAIVLYKQAVQEIVAAGGIPILFPSSAMQRMSEDELVAFHREIASFGRSSSPLNLASSSCPLAGSLRSPCSSG